MTSVAKAVSTLLTNLGAACVAAYGSIASAPLPVPSLVVQPAGTLAVTDCGDLLIVRAASIATAFTGSPQQCALVMVANLEATVTRCIPNLTDWGSAAAQADLTAAALALADDVSTLWYGLAGACRAGTLWAGFTDIGCEETTFGPARPGASGDIGFWTLPVSVTVGSGLT